MRERDGARFWAHRREGKIELRFRLVLPARFFNRSKRWLSSTRCFFPSRCLECSKRPRFVFTFALLKTTGINSSRGARHSLTFDDRKQTESALFFCFQESRATTIVFFFSGLSTRVIFFSSSSHVLHSFFSHLAFFFSFLFFLFRFFFVRNTRSSTCGASSAPRSLHQRSQRSRKPERG